MARITIYDARRVLRSLRGRIDRLTETRTRDRGRFRGASKKISPIADVEGAFNSDIDRLKSAYERMEFRVSNALDNLEVEL